MRWLDLLRARVKASSQAKVAKDLGFAASTISEVLRGVYPASTDAIEKAVMDRYGEVACPHLGQAIPATACQDYQCRSMPSSNYHALNHWAACQACPHNTHRKEQP